MGLFNEIVDSFNEVKDNIDISKEKLDTLQLEAKKAEKVGLKIQKKVEEFQFNIQGNLEKINEIADKYKLDEQSEIKKSQPEL